MKAVLCERVKNKCQESVEAFVNFRRWAKPFKVNILLNTIGDF